jgi:hypothetical protein
MNEPIVYMVPDQNASAASGRLAKYQDADSFGGDSEALHRTARANGWVPLFTTDNKEQ